MVIGLWNVGKNAFLMYGLVNKAVEEVVVMIHGESVWEQVNAKAGVDMDVFMSSESYSGDITYNLVAAASEVLKVSTEQILTGFGEHGVLHTAQEGCGELISIAGKTLPEFKRNLPDFHSRVTLIFPKLQPPYLNCTDITERKRADKENQEQFHELERGDEFTIGREDRVDEFKREVNRLLALFKQPASYSNLTDT